MKNPLYWIAIERFKDHLYVAALYNDTFSVAFMVFFLGTAGDSLSYQSGVQHQRSRQRQQWRELCHAIQGSLVVQ